MAKNTHTNRLSVLVAPAVIGAHANAPEGIGFRQRDVRWLIECFANWVEPGLQQGGINIQNTQVSRYLDSLVAEGLARKNIRRQKPRYSLTPLGLVDLMHRTVEPGYFPQKEHFFFLFTFMVNYRSRIREMVEVESKRFPYALQLELEELFNADALLDRQLYYTERELKKMEKRIDDQKGSSELTNKLLESGVPYRELAEEVEQRFPFTLYTKKPLRQMLSETTQRHGLWEMTVGGTRRNNLMWEPIRHLLEVHLEQLRELKKLDPMSWDDTQA